MKRFILSALLAAMTISLTVQCTTSHASENSYAMGASARDMTERNLEIKKSFTAVNVTTGIKLFYTVGSSNKVRIVGPEEQVEHTVVTVDDGTLLVYLDRDHLSRKQSINNLAVYVTAPAFRRVKMSAGARLTMATEMTVSDDFTVKGNSGAEFKSDKGLTCGTFKVDTSSGALVDINGLKTKECGVHTSSGAVVTLNGTTNTLKVNSSSGAVANLTGLHAKEGSLHASSGAVVKVNGPTAKGSSIHASSGAVVNVK